MVFVCSKPHVTISNLALTGATFRKSSRHCMHTMYIDILRMSLSCEARLTWREWLCQVEGHRPQEQRH